MSGPKSFTASFRYLEGDQFADLSRFSTFAFSPGINALMPSAFGGNEGGGTHTRRDDETFSVAQELAQRGKHGESVYMAAVT